MPNHKSTVRSVHEIADRFWSKVKKGRGKACWEWTASRVKFGYGQLACKGLSAQPLLAHRVSWELAYGPIPPGKHVLHRCDNPPCVRPDHLFLGDQRVNTEDRDRKGRVASGAANGAVTKPERNPFVRNGGSGLKGERHPMAKLSDKQVRRIRRRWAAGVYATRVEIALEFGVSPTHVGRILGSEGKMRCQTRTRAPSKN